MFLFVMGRGGKGFFWRNRSTGGETPRSKARTNDKLHPDMAPGWAGEHRHTVQAPNHNTWKEKASVLLKIATR